MKATGSDHGGKSTKNPGRGRDGSVAADRLPFSQLNGKRVEAVFDQFRMSSDGGAIVLRETLVQSGLIARLAESIRDPRNRKQVTHTLQVLLAQRVVQICQGYEDAIDCNFLRDDPAIKMAAGRDPAGPALASQSTMTRVENSATIRDVIRMGYALGDNFLDSFESPPKMMVIDMDPSAHRTYGDQQMSLFNVHYGGYCLMPFYVYEGLTGKLITTIVRPGKTPTDREILAILKRIVKRIRERFPQTVLLFRADSHHNKPAVLDWLEQHNVHYVLGQPTNPVLSRQTAPLLAEARRGFDRTWKKYRRFHSFHYAAGTWSRPRRVVARIEATRLGGDVRYIVTDLEQTGAKYLYETVYCGRGNAELMIKESKCFLKSDRSSCTSKLANQFRLFLHGAAYVLMHRMRDTLLEGTDLAGKTFGTIQLRLLKLAAHVVVGKTYIRVHLPADSPMRPIFAKVSAALAGIDST